MKNLDIYCSRLTSSLALFVILAVANVWLSPTNNTVLVLGYRLFILLTPLLFMYFRHSLSYVAFILAEIGVIFWLIHASFLKSDLINNLGTVLFAIGIAVSGYMLKYYSSFTTKGAASNKMAINLGSIMSGLIIVVTQNISYILCLSFIVLFISLILFNRYYKREDIVNFASHPHHFKLHNVMSLKGVAWALIGFVIGVKLISIVSVLPQVIMLYNHGSLPYWYGYLLILNSILVVVLQMPVMRYVKHLSRITSVLPLLLGMLIIALSGWFHLYSWFGAFLWVLILTIVECSISYLDKMSQDDHCLLIKESFVGIGSAATVYAVRFVDPNTGAVAIGVLSAIVLLIAVLMFLADDK